MKTLGRHQKQSVFKCMITLASSNTHTLPVSNKCQNLIYVIPVQHRSQPYLRILAMSQNSEKAITRIGKFGNDCYKAQFSHANSDKVDSIFAQSLIPLMQTLPNKAALELQAQ